jgi:hypothetical protein
MTPDRHTRRFDPRWLLPVIGANGVESFGTPDASARSVAEASTYDPVGVPFDKALAQFDEALEQIVTEGWMACALGGLIAAQRESFPR